MSFILQQHLDVGVKDLRQLVLQQLVQGGRFTFLDAEPRLGVGIVVESLGSTVGRFREAHNAAR